MTACGRSDAGSDPPAERTLVEAEWIPVWLRGGEERDTLLLDPRGIAVEGGLVYVVDRMGARVVAFRAEDGAYAWSAGRKGAGPGEFQSPSAIAAVPGSGVAVVDARNQRLTLLDRSGRLTRSVPMPRGLNPVSLCVMRDGTYLVANLAYGHAITHVGGDGAKLESADLPWPDLDGRSIVRRIAHLAPTSDGQGCWVALGLGRGFARYQRGEFGEPHRYVEFFDIPEVKVKEEWPNRSERLVQQRAAATSVAADGGALLVGFMGETRHQGRLIDIYDDRTGAYRHTLRLPKRIDGLARSGERYFVLSTQNGLPMLLALEAKVRP